MPVDAYPDLSPPLVEVITQWPGHAAEEIERLVTLPIELQMNGVPHMVFMRSISLYGLSDVIMTFEDSTDDYFARQVVFERLSTANLPPGATGSLAPLSSPSNLVYRYVIESPDRTPQELKTYEDWVIERAYKSVPGVADDSGFGGTVMQYQVLLDPAKIYSYHIPLPQVLNALSANNANAGGGFYSQGSQFFYVRGLGTGEPRPKTSATSSWATTTACRCASATSARSPSATRPAWENSVSRTMTTGSKASSSCSPASRRRTS
jgi:heavy metal efflux system protein